jgi:hypothetical protein
VIADPGWPHPRNMPRKSCKNAFWALQCRQNAEFSKPISILLISSGCQCHCHFYRSHRSAAPARVARALELLDLEYCTRERVARAHKLRQCCRPSSRHRLATTAQRPP